MTSGELDSTWETIVESGLMEAEGKKNTGIQTCGFDKLMLMSPKVLGKRGSTMPQQICLFKLGVLLYLLMLCLLVLIPDKETLA